MLEWFIAQVLIILYTRFSSWHHAPAVNAMRHYVPTPNPYESPFHFWSFWQAFIVSAVISLSILNYYHWFWSLQTAMLCVCWYSLLFDIWLNKGTDKNWDYIGSSSYIDTWLKRKFGVNAGKKKAMMVALTIIKINIIALIFM